MRWLLPLMLLLAGCGSNSVMDQPEGDMSESPSREPKAALKVNLRFVYHQCNDVKAVREFYGSLLGLKVGAFADHEKYGWVTLQSEGLELMFFRAESALPVHEEFSFIPGDGGGPGARAAWSVEVPEEEFGAVFRRLRDAGVKAQTTAPTWRQDSYWGYTVLDPMGNTVEVYCTVRARPKNTEWGR